ncbi:hypothetical protein AVEN_258380-1 [Araneus ventricosus]|nr:hypothetical protein AVEN_258380-1 [Araneus ventricosus]
MKKKAEKRVDIYKTGGGPSTSHFGPTEERLIAMGVMRTPLSNLYDDDQFYHVMTETPPPQLPADNSFSELCCKLLDVAIDLSLFVDEFCALYEVSILLHDLSTGYLERSTVKIPVPLNPAFMFDAIKDTGHILSTSSVKQALDTFAPLDKL